MNKYKITVTFKSGKVITDVMSGYSPRYAYEAFIGTYLLDYNRSRDGHLKIEVVQVD